MDRGADRRRVRGGRRFRADRADACRTGRNHHRARLCVVPRADSRHMDERPPQQDDPAGNFRSGQGRLRAGRCHPSGQPLRSPDPRRRVLHNRVGYDRQGTGAPHRLHSGQPPHPALPDDHRPGRNHRARAKLGRGAPRVVSQHGNRPAGRGRPADRATVEQELRRLSRQRSNEYVRCRDAQIPDGVDRFRHLVRALSRAR